ncbi:MAG TPA: hypothetical protein VGY66_23080 [Gemmataceae bacterium]|jgi:hypothetical protein|nr:hypothetical protein [Gemmataceae bacterium]
MSTAKAQQFAHSADVRIELCVNGHSLPVSHLGPDFLVLKDTVEHPPAEAEIAMSIDGQESRWQVHLVDGIIAGQQRTRIGRCK